ncbi:MAG: hypothetical protein QOG62_2839 [Thermoleophilaceae bacterium]|jgi:hypothetical protein|nr:hypothetical protein [Thermoleophilaceae bacterium]
MSDNHGNTPAAWSAVAIATLGFVVAGIGLMVGSWLMFWIGAALEPIALIVGKIVSMMGYGASQTHSATNH